jgi:hypothetical protein
MHYTTNEPADFRLHSGVILLFDVRFAGFIENAKWRCLVCETGLCAV